MSTQNSENYGNLSRQLKDEAARILGGSSHYIALHGVPALQSLLGEFNRLERIVSALESIGVNLDESDIEALEGIAATPKWATRDYLRDTFNNATTEFQEEIREREQEQAIEALTAAGFVLNDDDGETWTRGNEVVRVELVNGREARYKWEYESDHGCHALDGVSGEFHRLMALIAQSPARDARSIPPQAENEVSK